MKKIPIMSRLEKEKMALKEALKFARLYIVKGLAEGAYKNTAISGEKALERIDNFLDPSALKAIIDKIEVL